MLLLFLWSNRCWQFGLWFLCLSKSILNIGEFSVHVLLKPSLENFEHYFANMWNKCNFAVVGTFFGIAFLWDVCVCVCVCPYVHTLSHLSLVQLFATLWTVAIQSPLSMGILQAGIQEWIAMPSSRGSSRPRNWAHVSYICRQVLYH